MQDLYCITLEGVIYEIFIADTDTAAMNIFKNIRALYKKDLAEELTDTTADPLVWALRKYSMGSDRPFFTWVDTQLFLEYGD